MRETDSGKQANDFLSMMSALHSVHRPVSCSKTELVMSSNFCSVEEICKLTENHMLACERDTVIELTISSEQVTTP